MHSTFAIIFSMILAFAQGSTNFSGKWNISQPGRNGARAVSVLTVNQSGTSVSGTLTSGRIDLGTASPVNSEIFGAKVEGDTLSFYVWRGTDKPVKQFYKGVMSGDDINFTVTGGPVSPITQQPAANNQVTAKRAAE